MSVHTCISETDGGNYPDVVYKWSSLLCPNDSLYLFKKFLIYSHVVGNM